MLEQLLHNLTQVPDNSKRIIHGFEHNEDAVTMHAPPHNAALVQTLDILTPIGNNPRLFGQVAAANALSDVYAVGGEAWSCMNVLSFPSSCVELSVLKEILEGGIEKIIEADAVLAGGHTLEEDEIKYGLSVTGYIDPKNIASNDGLKPDDVLILTKPLGTGVLATAIKGQWEGEKRVEETEEILYSWATQLNRNAAQVIRDMHLKAATDITGFGLGGHVLEMAKASHCAIEIALENLPFMDNVLEFAESGLIPQGSFRNRKHCQCRTLSAFNKADDNQVLKATLVFDPQTSGGLLLAVPYQKVSEAKERLAKLNVPSWEIGKVLPFSSNEEQLILC